MLTIKVSVINHGIYFHLPTKSHLGDCGYDLYVAEDYIIPPNIVVNIGHNLNIEPPVGTWGLIAGRSSSLQVRGLHVMTGVLDNGYRGPVNATVLNLNGEDVHIKVGDRIAQLVLIPLVTPNVLLVDKLSQSDRGDKGYGSTGL